MVFFVVSPAYCPTKPLLSVSIICPDFSNPISFIRIPIILATVVLPVPGFPVNIILRDCTESTLTPICFLFSCAINCFWRVFTNSFTSLRPITLFNSSSKLKSFFLSNPKSLIISLLISSLVRLSSFNLANLLDWFVIADSIIFLASLPFPLSFLPFICLLSNNSNNLSSIELSISYPFDLAMILDIWSNSLGV